jgi:hypothetical protein
LPYIFPTFSFHRASSREFFGATFGLQQVNARMDL